MRLVAGTALIAHGIAQPLSWSLEPAPLVVLSAAAGLLLFAGLWTPISGALVAGIELWHAFSHPADLWPSILLGTLGVALSLLGPGSYSIDARLFGWKRIVIRDRQG
jgi:putative oxidoreductase